MTSQPAPRVFADTDYCYGTGPLTLRIQHIDWDRPIRYADDIWYHVNGVEMAKTGMERGRRHVLIRGRRLPAQSSEGRVQEPTVTGLRDQDETQPEAATS